MKTIKSNTYLVISSVQEGFDEDILKIYRQVQKKYGAKVFHLGPTISDKELSKYDRLTKKMADIDQQFAKYGSSLTAKQEDSLDDRASQVEFELGLMSGLEVDRVETLRKFFGKDMTFVSTKKLSLPEREKDKGFVFGGFSLSKYLYLSPIPPTGMKAVRNPINTTAMSFLKDVGKSWICAHPVPSVTPQAKPGLNNVWDCYTVGSLKHQRRPEKTNEQYAHSHMPCAVLVVVDERTGEFHARQLHIDYLSQKFEGDSNPVVLDDGLVFTPSKVMETKSPDRASVSTDDHAPYTHPGVIGCIKALNKLHQPKTFINMGDAADFDPISRHTASLPGAREGLRLREALRSLKKLLDAQTEEKSIKERVLIDSNHHEWLTLFVQQHPELKGWLDWKTVAKEWFPEWNLLIRGPGENQVYQFGDYHTRHGDKDGNAKKAEMIFPKGKYLCGHFHRLMSYRRATQLGCGAKLGPAYTGDDINAWQNMIASMTKYKGVAAVAPKVVLHDKKRKVSRFSYRNKIYEVPHFNLF